MKLKINELESNIISNLTKIGFDRDVSVSCTKNIIEAEISGKKTHGIIRVLHLKNWLDKGKTETQSYKLKIIRQTKNHLHIDGNKLPGFYAIDKSLEIAIKAMKESSIFMVGIKNVGITGFIGDYARRATENNLIYIGFHNSIGGIAPFGSTKDTWGTDPVTFGFPAKDLPIIFDSASSKITWGDLMLARKSGNKLPSEVALDDKGRITTDPNMAVTLIPFFGYKGSGFAMSVEMLAGVLTGSGVGNSIPGGWGSFYILIDPEIFKPIKEFKMNTDKVINELKSLPKAKGVKEIFYPGEKSGKLRKENLRKGWVEVDDEILSKIKQDLK